MIFILMFGLIGCSDVIEYTEDSVYFIGEVITKNDNHLLVEITQGGTSNIGAGTQASFSLPKDNKIEVSVGDIIRVECGGEILESYPIQIPNILSVSIIEHKQEEIKPKVIRSIESKVSPDMSFPAVLEKFYEDDNYEYYFGYPVSSYIVVTYTDNTSQNIVDALRDGYIEIEDLDKYNIIYFREERVG
jgi:hypothetical protein